MLKHAQKNRLSEMSICCHLPFVITRLRERLVVLC